MKRGLVIFNISSQLVRLLSRQIHSALVGLA